MINATIDKHKEKALMIEVLAAPRYSVTAIIKINSGETHIKFS